MSFMSNDFQVLFPELLLAIGAMALLVLGVLRGDRSLGLVSWLSIILLVVTGWFVLFPLTQFNKAFHGAFIADDFARFAKILILIGTGLTILMSQEYLEREKIAHFEFPVLLVLSTVGMFLMVSASSFIAVYMGLELQSLALYVLAAFNRDSLQIKRSGPQIFRPGRAVVRHDAVRHLPDLRLHGHDGILGHRPCDDVADQYRPDLRHRVSDRGLRVQGLGRAVPYVDAGRL